MEYLVTSEDGISLLLSTGLVSTSMALRTDSLCASPETATDCLRSKVLILRVRP